MSNTLTKSIETFLDYDNEYGSARTVLFSMLFDPAMSFHPSARFAGHAMRGDLSGSETYNLCQGKDLTGTSIFDGGDLELCFGDT